MAEPRYLILPEGIVASGWPAVRDTSAKVGILYDPWQQDLNRAMLAKDSSGMYAADTVVLSMCRQSGKTYDVGGVSFADSIIHPGTTTVWTAHRFKVARETFNELRSLATMPKMSPHIDPDEITTAAGNECISFRNGSRIVFAARERGAIRGFTKVRRLILDEAQILTEAAMSDLAPTTNQAANPQIILMGTPPKPQDPGEVLTNLRELALAGSAERLMYCEYSADRDCDLDDWDAVAEANPSYPKRTPRRAVERLRKLLTNDADYAREVLGIWGAQGSAAVIPADVWGTLRDPESRPRAPFTIAVAVNPERTRSALVVAARQRGNPKLVHVEITSRGGTMDYRPGTSWVVPRVADIVAARDAKVVLDPASPTGGLLTELREAGIEPEPVSGREYQQACGAFYDAAMGIGEGGEPDASLRTIVHLGQPALNVAVDGGGKRKIGDAWVWHPQDASVDIEPLKAATLAFHGVRKPSDKRERTGEASFV